MLLSKNSHVILFTYVNGKDWQDWSPTHGLLQRLLAESKNTGDVGYLWVQLLMRMG